MRSLLNPEASWLPNMLLSIEPKERMTLMMLSIHRILEHWRRDRTARTLLTHSSSISASKQMKRAGFYFTVMAYLDNESIRSINNQAQSSSGHSLTTHYS